MWSIVRSSLWARRGRLVRTCVAVAVGIAFLTGTLVLGDTLTANFRQLFTDVSAGTDVVVRNATTVSREAELTGDRGPIDARLVERIATMPGVATAEPQVVGFGTLLGADGDAIGGNGPPRQAGSWVTTTQLNPYRLVEGRAPVGPGEVVINRGAADQGKLHVGDATTVLTPQPVAVRIVGIARFGNADGLGQATWTAFDLPAAQAVVLGGTDRVTSVLVAADAGISSEALRDRIAAALPDGLEAITGTQLADQRIDAIGSVFLDQLKTFLTAFAVIALAVATLTIANSFSITVAQRARELALLRAVGASRRQVRAVVSLEALAIGLVASGVGIVAGLGVAGLLKGMFDAFGGALPAGGMTLRPATLLIGLAVGVVVTVVAAQLPARRASRVAPVAALREVQSAARPPSVGRIVTGTTLVVVGGAAAWWAASGSTVVLVGPAALALVVGSLLLAPLALPLVVGLIAGAVGRLRGGLPRRAAADARRDPSRAAATSTALVIGVAVVSLFTVFAASMKSSLEGSVDDAVRVDFVVNTDTFGGSRLDPGVVEALEALPEVDSVAAIGGGSALLDGVSAEVTATDPATIDEAARVDVVAGSLDGVGDAGLAISTTRARDEGWRVGTPVSMTFSDGAVEPFTVAAVYEDNVLLGGVVVDREVWRAHTTQPTERMALVGLAGSVTPSQARQAIAPVATRHGGDLQDRAEFAAARTAGLDTLLAVVYVLLALAVIIALVGIANALSLSVHERRREIGLLRAIGQTRRQTRSLLRWEAAMLVGFGTLVGIALGVVSGWTLFEAISTSSGFTVPVVRLLIVAVVGTLAGALAARRPARRAAKVPVLDAIASR